MSVASAQEFFERAMKDEELQKKLDSCETLENWMATVKSYGFDFTADEFEQAKGMLNDAQLEGVQGGNSWGPGLENSWGVRNSWGIKNSWGKS